MWIKEAGADLIQRCGLVHDTVIGLLLDRDGVRIMMRMD